MTVRKTRILKSVIIFLLSLFLFLPQTVVVEAVTTEHNSDSGYDLILDDDADFLTDADEDSLVEIMTKITDYCNVALVTTTSHSFYSTEDFAADYFDSTFGAHASGTIFVMAKRTRPLPIRMHIPSRIIPMSMLPNPMEEIITPVAMKRWNKFLH